MTIIAGLFGWDDNDDRFSEIKSSLRSTISRNPDDAPIEHSGRNFYFVKVDIGAYGVPASTRSPEHGVAIAAGDPVLVEAGGADATSRETALEILGAEWSAGGQSATKRVQGAFCAAHIDAAESRLMLVNDKLGQRPVYYYLGTGFVVFSSAFRVLEALAHIPKSMDFQALCELGAYRCSLDDRTVYGEIRCLGPAGILRVDRGGQPHLSQYWEWDSIELTELPYAAAVDRAYDLFMTAIDRRALRDERTVATFLSGGMDSRLINSALRLAGKTVHSFNFFDGESQDKVLSAMAAEALGTEHHPYEIGFRPFVHPSTFLKDAQESIGAPVMASITRPGLVWSGDGGSFGLGRIYLTEEMCDLARDGRIEAAASAFIEYNDVGLPYSFLQRSHREIAKSTVVSSLVSQLKSYDCRIKGNEILLFVLLNDQRKHLFKHLENIDVDRRELILPFFDSDFLSFLVSLPVKETLFHRFYDDLFRKFPSEATSVPWQTYPDHVPCPLPLPARTSYQWDKTRWSAVIIDAWRNYRRVAFSLFGTRFPSSILDRLRVATGTVLTFSGTGDYRYMLEFTDSIMSALDNSRRGDARYLRSAACEPHTGGQRRRTE